MKKTTDIICLIGWSMSLGFGILAACGVTTVSPTAHICAVLVCIFHYSFSLFTPQPNNKGVAYICDEKACESCNHGSVWAPCYHTVDVNHAVNFKEIAPGKFIEKFERYRKSSKE